MWDATSQNAHLLVPLVKPGDLLAIYLTGTPDIRWTTTQVANFPKVKTFVRIDQAGATAPQSAATVKDVEPGAYRPSDIPNFKFDATVQRPTVYCDRNDLPDVMKVWSRDIWLAAPGLSETQCLDIATANKQIVAVQNVFNAAFDKSVVIDPFWPNKAPVPTPPPNDTVEVEYYKPQFGWVATPTIVIPRNSPHVRVRINSEPWTQLF